MASSTVNRPLVEGPADDHAVDVGRRLGAQPLEVGERRRPRPSRSPRRRSPPPPRRAARSPGPAIVPSTSIGVKRKRSTPAQVRLGDRRRRASTRVVSVQPASETLPSRASTETTIRSPCAFSIAGEELRVAHRRGADHHPFGPRPQHVGDARRRRAVPPPTWIGQRTAAAIRRIVSRFTGLPAFAPSRSTTWRIVAPRVGQAHRRVHRVGVVDRLAVVVALRPAAPRGRRGYRWRDRGSRRDGRLRADPGEVGEQPQPGGARLLGVELDAEDVAALGRAGEAGAVRRRCRAVVRGGSRARRSGRGRTASRSRSRSVSRDSRSQRTGAQPMCGTLRPGASSSRHLARQQAEAGRAAELGRSLEEQLQAEADAEDRRPRRRGARRSARRGRARPDPLHRPREGADAGQDQPVGGAHRSGSVLIVARAPTCSSAFSTERRLPIP